MHTRPEWPDPPEVYVQGNPLDSESTGWEDNPAAPAERLTLVHGEALVEDADDASAQRPQADIVSDFAMPQPELKMTVVSDDSETDLSQDSDSEMKATESNGPNAPPEESSGRFSTLFTRLRSLKNRSA